MPEILDNSLTEYFGYCAQARLGEIYPRNMDIGKMFIADTVVGEIRGSGKIF